jgi:hypothetical protein
MIPNKLYKIGLIFALIMSVGLTGCKSDDDDETKNGNGGSNGGSKDASAGDDAGTSEDGVTFTGRVVDVVESKAVPGIDVIPLSNDVDFTELGDKVTTDDDGKFTFEGLEDGLMCVKVMATEGDVPTVDTYTCNVPTDQQDIEVSTLQLTIAEMISSQLYPGVEPDPSMASASGFIVYKTDAGSEIPVDCATIEVEDETQEPDIFYFAGVMPDPKATQTDSMGRFLVTRLDPGEVTLIAKVDGEKIGEVTIPIQAPVESGAIFNSNITKIIAEGTGDPSPGTCE